MFKMDKEDKASWTLFLSCFIVYVLISMTKNAYSAAMAAILSEGLFTKSQAGFINSGFYLMYGLAQLLGVRLVDRVSPITLISIAIGGTAVACVGMGLSNCFVSMLIIWSACGLAQFAIWPAVLRVLAEYLLPPHRQRAMVYIAFAYCTGCLINYAGAALVLKLYTWQALFFVNSCILVVAFVVWNILATRTSKVLNEANATYKIRANNTSDTEKADQRKSSVSFGKLISVSGLLFLFVPVFCRTALDSGLKSWVPTMIMENYGVSASFATVLTTILVVVNLAGVFLLNFLYPKRIKNAVTVYMLFYLLALPFTVLLVFTGKLHVAFIVLFLIVITTIMYGGNQLGTVIIPAVFSKYNCAGGVASLINAIASFGIVITSFGYGVLTDKFGWGGTITAWIIVDILGALFCLIAMPKWNKFTKE